MEKYIPVNEPLIKGNEKKYLCKCIDEGWISSEGNFVRKFENNFAAYHNVKNGVAVSSGTAALETALYALGVESGDEVIMPTFTIISCAIACLRIGAVPVIVDIDPQTWTMDVSAIEPMINHRTKVIMPVHIYGHAVEMDEIFRLRDKYGLKILEDSAEAHGAEYYSEYLGDKWIKCGAMGDISATSFYANKIISTGEGGMILTDNDEYAERARSYRNLCFLQGKRFLHTDIGYNFRMTNLQAAVGVAQLEQIDRFLEIKKKFWCIYRDKLSGVQGLRFMSVKNWARSVYWMYCVELDSDLGITANEMMSLLNNRGIGTRPFFRGLHKQPALKGSVVVKHQNYPNAESSHRFGFYLPSGLSLSEEDVVRVTDALKEELNS